ncbi:MAG: hypothetical protein H6990_10780 [Pseudomonadales bacterium]|nr:hypothetical protein [Pseudomonadales bacterium]
MLQMTLLLFFLAPLVMAAAPVSDTVNERIPVSRVELEAHWQVDCGAAWAELEQLAGATGQCAPGDRLRHTPALAAHLPAPGEEVAAARPDFAAALTCSGEPCPDSCRSLANFPGREGTLFAIPCVGGLINQVFC